MQVLAHLGSGLEHVGRAHARRDQRLVRVAQGRVLCCFRKNTRKKVLGETVLQIEAHIGPTSEKARKRASSRMPSAPKCR